MTRRAELCNMYTPRVTRRLFLDFVARPGEPREHRLDVLGLDSRPTPYAEAGRRRAVRACHVAEDQTAGLTTLPLNRIRLTDIERDLIRLEQGCHLL